MFSVRRGEAVKSSAVPEEQAVLEFVHLLHGKAVGVGTKGKTYL